MSREIKFRAWHMPFGPKRTMQEMVHGKASRILAFAEMSPDEYIVEQYTGLKDKKGCEIYEGDILFYQEDYEDGFFAPVIYGSENLYYPAFDLDWHYIPKSYFFESNAISEGVANDYLIVAGNIHENPELLEADK